MRENYVYVCKQSYLYAKVNQKIMRFVLPGKQHCRSLCSLTRPQCFDQVENRKRSYNSLQLELNSSLVYTSASKKIGIS